MFSIKQYMLWGLFCAMQGPTCIAFFTEFYNERGKNNEQIQGEQLVHDGCRGEELPQHQSSRSVCFTKKPLPQNHSVLFHLLQNVFSIKRVANVLQKRIAKNAKTRKVLILLDFSAPLSRGGHSHSFAPGTPPSYPLTVP